MREMFQKMQEFFHEVLSGETLNSFSLTDKTVENYGRKREDLVFDINQYFLHKNYSRRYRMWNERFSSPSDLPPPKMAAFAASDVDIF